jgi:hypothetical protein
MSNKAPENKTAELAKATAPKKPRVAKKLLNVARDERVDFTASVKVGSAEVINAYAKFSGASVGDVVDSLAELLAKKDKCFAEWRKAQQPAS